MKTIIISLVKNKSGDTSDVNNYRPIALVMVASKIFEIVLLELMKSYLDITDNSFGFKTGHSADHCIYVFKNVIQYYRSYNSPVYMCFLDASKAFDRVNHWTLFRKLLNRGVPVLLIRILLYLVENPNVLYGVPRPLTSLMYQTVFNKVGFYLPTYLLYSLMI